MLRERLTRPMASVVAIRRVQDALRFMQTHRAAFGRLPTAAEVRALEQYLDSRFTTVSSARGPGVSVESLWVRFRYPELHRTARHGVDLCRTTLEQWRRFVGELFDPPELVRDLASECARLIEDERLAPIRTQPRWASPRSTFLGDHAARGEGLPVLRRLLDLRFELDALLSMADVSAEKGFTFPEIDPDGVGIAVEGVWHPFLEQPVANDLSLEHGARLVFVTGPNMAGKSTYLKACGIVGLLAHTGMGVPARHCRLPVFDRIISSIRAEDDLRGGVSYFQAEARRVREIVSAVAAGESCLIIADELFRGTNVKDACDASLAVLEAIAGSPRVYGLVASHLAELAEPLGRLPAVKPMRFEAAIDRGEPTFDYRLSAGTSNQRLGMLVLQTEGVLDLLARIRTATEGSPAHGG